MTLGDKGALEALNARIDHVAATAKVLSECGTSGVDFNMAVRGIAETLRLRTHWS